MEGHGLGLRMGRGRLAHAILILRSGLVPKYIFGLGPMANGILAKFNSSSTGLRGYMFLIMNVVQRKGLNSR